jgi:hypothetical protein
MSLGDARTEPGIFRDTVGQLPNIKLKPFDVHFAALRVGLAQAGASCIMPLPSNKASYLQLWKKISEPAMRLAMKLRAKRRESFWIGFFVLAFIFLVHGRPTFRA